MNDKTSNFPNIVKHLEVLNDLLKCNSCKERMDAPVTLQSCDHVFCCHCLASYTHCPLCNMPAWAKDQTKNSRLENISSLGISLENIINNSCNFSNQKSNFVQSNDSQPTNQPNVKSVLKNKFSKISTNPGRITLKRLSKENICISKTKKQKQSEEEKNKSEKSVKRFCKSVVISKQNTTKKSNSIAPMQKNARGETPLHLAAMQGDMNQVEKLISKKADVNAKDYAGWTPLHEACNKGYVDVVEKLLNAGALIDIPGYNNDTPLIDAVSNNRLSVVQLLLKHGANVNLRNSDGKTALELAQSKKIYLTISKQLQNCSEVEIDDVFSKVKPEVFSISFSEINPKKIKLLSKLLNATVTDNSAINCSHFIVSFNEELKTKRTLKYLQAMATGAWIVNEKWIDICLKAESWISEINNQVKGSFEDIVLDGPLRSRRAKLKCLPRLFNGCHFFLYGQFSLPFPTKQQLIELIKAAGGQILSREPKPDNDIVQSCRKVPYHAKPDTPQFYFTYYILYDPAQKFLPRSVQLGKVCTVSASWLLDCISQFMICDTS